MAASSTRSTELVTTTGDASRDQGPDGDIETLSSSASYSELSILYRSDNKINVIRRYRTP